MSLEWHPGGGPQPQWAATTRHFLGDRMQDLGQPGQFRLSDGRRLAYRIYGEPDGAPVYYFHGWPGSSLEIGHCASAAQDQQVCLVALDRPGLGESDFQPGRTLLDWPQDVGELSSHLGHQTFSVFGCSGGAPYALACGYALHGRVRRVALACPMGPIHHPAVRDLLPALHRWILPLGRFESLVRVLCLPIPYALIGGVRSPLVQLAVALIKVIKPPADGKALSDDRILRSKIGAGQAAFSQGVRGVARDAQILSGHWAFDPKDVVVPVRLWHGERDGKLPPSITAGLAAVLPSASSCYDPEAGHTSIYVDHISEILGWVTEA